jgi:uncharacterized membrane protein YkoI
MRTTKVHTPSLVLLAAVAAVVATGCSADSENSATTDSGATAPAPSSPGSPGTTAEPPSESPTTGQPRAAEAPLDAISAIESAASILPGEVVAGGRTTEEGTRVWYLTVRDDDGSQGSEIYLNRRTGELVKQQSEVLQPAARGDLPPVSAREALSTALRSAPGASVVEFDLEREDGVRVWYVLVRGGASGQQEIYVDAASGVVLTP